jgi:hypothetical protein
MALGMSVAPDMAGCSVTQADGSGYRTPVTSNDLAVAVDRAQYDAGAGPCLTAAADAEIQRIDAMEDSGYPGFAAAATLHGVQSSLSLPLTGGPEPAALNFYASTPAAFGPERPRAVADLLARCVTALMHGDPARTSATREDIVTAVAGRRLIRDAEDALMMSDRLSRADAYHRLALRSRVESRSIFDLARELLGRADPKARR